MLIEIRPIIEKQKLKNQIRKLKDELRLVKTHKVPHLTLVYNFQPRISPYEIAEIIQRVARRYANLTFRYNGWELQEGKGGHVFGFKITPSDELKNFRWELYNNLKGSIIQRGSDAEFSAYPPDDFWFHSAIAFHMDSRSTEKVRDYLKNPKTEVKKGIFNFIFHRKPTPRVHPIKPVVLDTSAIRISILRKKRIAYEYDTVLDRIFDRRHALSSQYMKLTLERYRKKIDIEVPEEKHKNKPVIWLISDTHFNHQNIIGFTSRPFSNIEEMNEVMIRNWNNTVSKGDKVYILGDVCHWSNKKKQCTLQELEKWTDQLNGDKVLIRSNHTPFGEGYATWNYNGIKFLLIHNPNPESEENKKFKKVFKGFDGWIIHGDKHNMDLVNYPFINYKTKTINVCVELIKYKPISLDTIIELISEPRKGNILTL